MPLNKPYQITVPFAQNGLKNNIPVASQAAVLAGAASFTDGFPPLTMQPIAAGGVPPYGQDMNGVLFAVTEALRWMQAGALYPYDSTFANAVGGYPLGAMVSRPDGSGFWRNITDNNKTDPSTFGAGWETELSGITSIALSNANVTLTALQASKQIIVLTGSLSANINIIFPTQYKQTYTVINKCTGNFSVTCKTLNGAGVSVSSIEQIVCDGTDILSICLNMKIGVPFPWPLVNIPANCIKCNGASFNKTMYPKLAVLYPSGTSPDLRAQVIRGLDDGRGIDSGRSILSAQEDAIRNISGGFYTAGYSDGEGTSINHAPSGPFSIGGKLLDPKVGSLVVGEKLPSTQTVFDASKVVPTASENRVKNIAFLYIMRAE